MKITLYCKDSGEPVTFRNLEALRCFRFRKETLLNGVEIIPEDVFLKVSETEAISLTMAGKTYMSAESIVIPVENEVDVDED